MRKISWLLFLMLISATALCRQAPPAAQPQPATPSAAPAVSNTATATNAAATNAPSQTTKKKSSRKKGTAKATAKKKDAAAQLRTVPLVAGPAIVVASNVNVRGQAKLKSEVISKLTKGDQVTVLEEVNLKNSGPDEPSAWAKIILPRTTHVWVHGSFVDRTNGTVSASKLKLRGGPGENYSVLGMLQKGDPIKEVNSKGDWIEIEPPGDAYAFVAAQYLSQENVPAIASATPTEPAATTDTNQPAATATVPETTPLAAAPTEPPAAVTPETPEATNTTPAALAAAAEAAAEALPKRIVQREGVVRGTLSIQAPTKFELMSPETGRLINYLFTTSVDLDLRRYKGMRIIVTGEESLDARWRNTPIITIQRIQVLE